MVVGRLLSYWEGNCSGVVINFEGAHSKPLKKMFFIPTNINQQISDDFRLNICLDSQDRFEVAVFPTNKKAMKHTSRLITSNYYNSWTWRGFWGDSLAVLCTSGENTQHRRSVWQQGNLPKIPFRFKNCTRMSMEVITTIVSKLVYFTYTRDEINLLI